MSEFDATNYQPPSFSEAPVIFFGAFQRLLAFLIDLIIIFFVAVVITYPFSSIMPLLGGLVFTNLPIIFCLFYFTIFGVDQVRWMFINAGLGLLGIYAQIDMILSLFDKRTDDFPPSVHVIPFLYYILYTFLLYQLLLRVSGAHKSAYRKRLVERLYVAGSLLVYGGLFLINKY